MPLGAAADPVSQAGGERVTSVTFVGSKVWHIPAPKFDNMKWIKKQPYFEVIVQDLLVGHGGKLSTIRAEDFLIKADLIP